MPAILLPLLKQYWKPLLVGGLVLAVGFYIWILRNELAACQGHVAMFQAVQANNGAAIKAQNAAVRKLWKETRDERKAIDIANKENAVLTLQAMKTAAAPALQFAFKADDSCDEDVRTIYEKMEAYPWIK